MPIIATRKKDLVASQNWNVPVNIVAKANRNTIKLDASLIRLSPSRIVITLFGTFSPLNTEFAATASGGDMMPPNKKPNASVKPGMIACETNATTADVMMTRPNANKIIGRFHFQKSIHDVFQAAAYNKGGRKIRNARSGLRVINGTPGTRLIRRPAITSKIGYEILSLLLR